MKVGFDDLLGYNLIEIARKVNVLMNKELENIGITFPQYRLISRLWLEGELTQKELHELLSISAATLTPMIKTLEKKGLIVRKTDKNDGRSNKISITDLGVELRNQAFETVMNFEKQYFNTMQKEETQLLLKWLKKINSELYI